MRHVYNKTAVGNMDTTADRQQGVQTSFLPLADPRASGARQVKPFT